MKDSAAASSRSRYSSLTLVGKVQLDVGNGRVDMILNQRTLQNKKKVLMRKVKCIYLLSGKVSV